MWQWDRFSRIQMIQRGLSLFLFLLLSLFQCQLNTRFRQQNPKCHWTEFVLQSHLSAFVNHTLELLIGLQHYPCHRIPVQHQCVNSYFQSTLKMHILLYCTLQTFTGANMVQFCFLPPSSLRTTRKTRKCVFPTHLRRQILMSQHELFCTTQKC